ncbi:MAG TPA: adenylosuccinate lyase [Acidimicrobiia bacterium]
MIARYTLPEMALVWEESNRLEIWRKVEALSLEAWSDLGAVPAAASKAAWEAELPTAAEVAERERITDHDLAAFVDLVAERMSEGSEWLHYGLTSSDVLDTAAAVQMVEATDLLLAALAALFGSVKRRAFEHRQTLMLGRTHGIWAEPTTFGLKLCGWAFELERDHRRLAAARRSIAVGKVSGAVGTYAHVPPAVEAHVCSRLGLEIEPASTQVTARDRHAEWVQAAALTGASIERFATEVRHLQRSEVGELREPFGAGQKGSSAMPHKRNPIVSERMVGLARLLRGYATTALENVALWHERDISHSSAERVVFPDAALSLYYMLVRFKQLVDGLEVDSERMAANLDATRGLVYSQAVLLAMVANGMERDAAYRVVQLHAQSVWREGGNLHDHLAADPDTGLGPDQLGACFDPERFLVNAGVVFDRLEELDL